MVILKLKKHKFHQRKSPISINNTDINKIVVSDKVSLEKKGSKNFIGYKDGKKVRPSCILSVYRREYDGTKYISL